MSPVAYVDLSMDQAWRLRKPVKGNGGMQRLLRKLQSQVRWSESGRVLDLFPGDEEGMLRYAGRYGDRYGGGGYQGRFKSLLQGVKKVKEVA